MDSWGFNPSTLQAIGGFATALALFGVIAGSFASLWSSRVTSRDFSFRTRPWVSLAGVEFDDDVPDEDIDPDDLDESDETESRPDVLTLEFQNVGTVPAQKRSIELRLKPRFAKDWEMTPFRSQIGVLFPNEPSSRRYRFTGKRGVLLSEWKASKFELKYEGIIRYSFGDNNSYLTRFSGRLNIGSEGRKTWHNDEAI